MNWLDLLSLARQGDTAPRERKNQSFTRIAFDVDYDRLIFSNAFRNLQGKTELIPIPDKEFVHTRITHALESASIGRSLGRAVGVIILDKYPELKEKGYIFTDFGAIVSTACLAQNIGKPPFGYFGDKAISQFFTHGEGKEFKVKLSNLEWLDLTNFEGAANSFKILTKGIDGLDGGLRLSYSVIATSIKYPKASFKVDLPKVWQKRFGYFQSEREEFLDIAQTIGLKGNEKEGWSRHPLNYLVEAAKDISNVVLNFEDAINLGWISEEIGLESLLPIVGDKLNRDRYFKLTNLSDRIGYLRAIIIGVLIEEVILSFQKYEEDILKGEFNSSLLKKTKYEAAIVGILENSKKAIFKNTKVIELEISGFQVVNTLLCVFIKAMNDVRVNQYQSALYSKHVIRLLPKVYHCKEKDSSYDMLMRICNFVAGLTQKHAIHLYRKLKGQDF